MFIIIMISGECIFGALEGFHHMLENCFFWGGERGLKSLIANPKRVVPRFQGIDKRISIAKLRGI